MARSNIYANGNNFNEAKRSQCVKVAPDDEFIQDVAKSAKARWDKHATENWCGHCGAPSLKDPLKDPGEKGTDKEEVSRTIYTGNAK